MFGLAMTQPDKIHMHEFHHPLWRHVLPLLRRMETVFGNISADANEVSAAFEAVTLGNTCSASKQCAPTTEGVIRAAALMRELRDCVEMTALRAKQVRLLYQSKDPATPPDERCVRASALVLPQYIPASVCRLRLLSESRGVLEQADAVVRRREEFYRVPVQRIASWRENPTVYRYGYLWAVHSLYYWWRDQGLAEEGNMHAEISPCYLNRMVLSMSTAYYIPLVSKPCLRRT
jgi:hypothetical protein